MALRVRGDGRRDHRAVSAMRGKMLRSRRRPDAADVVGTGGDGSGSVNVIDLRFLHCRGRRRAGHQNGTARLSSRSGAAEYWPRSGSGSILSPDQVGRCVQGKPASASCSHRRIIPR